MWSKNGSIPKPETDGTEGWIEVPDAPECPAGKEVVWWYPPGWVIRDPQPAANWSWSQSEERWVEYVASDAAQPTVVASVINDQLVSLSSGDVAALTSIQISAM